MTGHLTAAQVDYLLRPIQPHRVHEDRKNRVMAHLPQQDVRAHLTRVFGFGGWSSTVTDSSMIHGERVTWMKDGQQKSGWDAVWRARVRLTIRDGAGEEVAQYEDEATGEATHQVTCGAAHDLALKSAVSTALKRAATSLGDQFGLSLYNKGSREQFVIFTLTRPDQETPPAAEVPAATEESNDVDGRQLVDVDGVHDPAPRRELPTDTPAEVHRERAKQYAADNYGPQHDGERPMTADEELEFARRARRHRDEKRRADALSNAKGRLWDAGLDLWRAELNQPQLVARLTDLLGVPLAQATTDQLNTAADMLEKDYDDAILIRHGIDPTGRDDERG